MKGNLIIYNARIVTPLGQFARRGKEMSQLHIIESGMIVVTCGIISYVGVFKSDFFEIEYQDFLCYNARGRCVLPGFVDSHTHFVFGGLRADEFLSRLRGESYMQIMQHGGGIMSTVKATRKMSFEELVMKSKFFLKRMSCMGVTTVEGKSGYGLDCDTEITQLKVMKYLAMEDDARVDIISTFLGAHALPEEYAGRDEEYIDFLIKEMLPRVWSSKLAECCDVFCEEGVFSIDESRRLLTTARDMGFKLKIHADEIASLGGAELAAELNALSADHLLHVSDKGILAMAREGVVATLLPLTAFALKDSYAPARKMIEEGCAVALATDLNPGSCLSGSIPLTFALACIHMGLSVEEAITAITLNGAAALNRADSIGSIEEGKLGDLVILNSDNYNVLAYYIGMNCVHRTVKRGVLFEPVD